MIHGRWWPHVKRNMPAVILFNPFVLKRKFLYFILFNFMCMDTFYSLQMLFPWFYYLIGSLIRFIYLSWLGFGINNLELSNFSIYLKRENGRKQLFLIDVDNRLYLLYVFNRSVKLFLWLILLNQLFSDLFCILSNVMDHLHDDK